MRGYSGNSGYPVAVTGYNCGYDVWGYKCGYDVWGYKCGYDVWGYKCDYDVWGYSFRLQGLIAIHK